MNISGINYNNNQRVNFKASISPQVRYQLNKQLENYKGLNREKIAKALEEQIKKVSGWGTNDSEIVFARDYRGQYRMGLQYTVSADRQYAIAIKGPQGKSELTQFMALTQRHISNAEDTIKYFYNKFGGGFFNRFK